MALELLWTGGVAAALSMAVLWAIQLRTRNANAVDVAWAGTIATLAIYYAVRADGWLPRRCLAAGLAGIWGYRLAGFLLFTRVLGGAAEDGRYAALRPRWGQGIFFVFFQAQGLLALLLSGPFLIAALDTTPAWTPFDIAGAALWLFAFIGETVADRQLDRFKRDGANRGTTCRAGLWRYSRHPNYFFEWLIWCGFALLAVGSPYGWLAPAAPILIIVSILKITGIPPTEEQALKSRGEDYRRYQETTSAFFPWFPRRESA